MNAFELDSALQLKKWLEEHPKEEPEVCSGGGTWRTMCQKIKGHDGEHYWMMPYG